MSTAMRILRDNGLDDGLTVRQLIKMLADHDPESKVLLRLGNDPEVAPIHTVDAYVEDELEEIRPGEVALRDMPHPEFVTPSPTCVVLAADEQPPRCQGCRNVLESHEADACDQCEELAVEHDRENMRALCKVGLHDWVNDRCCFCSATKVPCEELSE